MPPSCALLGGFAISAQDALLWQHYGNAWQSPAVIRQAPHTPHAPAMKSTRLLHVRHYLQRGCSISSILPGVATRTQNVSEYMLVLTLCLVVFMRALISAFIDTVYVISVALETF